MDYQRRSQFDRDGTGRRGGWSRLVLAALALIFIGCTADLRDPVGLTPGTSGGTTSGGGSGGGTSSGGTAAEALVGSWENLLAIGMSGDFQTIRTRWDFQRGGACRQTVRTFSVLDGVDFTTVRDCDFTINNGNVIVNFTGSMSSVSFSLSFPGFMTDRILLGGIEFDRTS